MLEWLPFILQAKRFGIIEETIAQTQSFILDEVLAVFDVVLA